MTRTFISPPIGDRVFLVHELFLYAARNNPTSDFAVVLDESGFPRKISWASFLFDFTSLASAIAPLIHAKKPSEKPPVVGLLAKSGYQYAVYILAILYNGWTVLPISPRNSSSGIDHLLESAHASHLFADEGARAFVGQISSSVPITMFCDIETHRFYVPAPSITSEDSIHQLEEPAFLVHTSGSTGHPKLIPWSHRFCLAAVKAAAREYGEENATTLYHMAPLFHVCQSQAMGILGIITMSIAVGLSIILPESQAPLTGEIFIEHLHHFERVIVTGIPLILEQAFHLGPEAVKELARRTTLVVFGGAPLDKGIGDSLVAEGVQLRPTYGSTETGLGSVQMPLSLRGKFEWEYVTMRKGYQFKLLDVPGDDLIKELLIMSEADQLASCNFDDPPGLLTGDIFHVHPKHSTYWKHMGRSGNITVLRNGEKVNNRQIVSAETIVLKDRSITNVVVFGNGRDQVGVLVEPASSFENPIAFLNRVWPTIQGANAVLPRHARILRPLVLCTDQKRPMVLTDKGTVKTRETLPLYTLDIEAAYDSMTYASHLELPSQFTEASVLDFIHRVFEHATGLKISSSEDFFDRGMDSLQAAMLHASINGILKHFSPDSVTLAHNAIYRCSTAEQLAALVLGKMETTSNLSLSTTIDLCIKRHLPSATRVAVEDIEDNGDIVILTGSTGSLGSFILHELIQSSAVRHVYCFNRSSQVPAIERQLSSFIEKGLDASAIQDSSRIHFLDVDLSVPSLGIDAHFYEQLRRECTHIIHGAWRLDFKMQLNSFEHTHIEGVRYLSEFAIGSPRSRRPLIVFLSSISAWSNWPHDCAIPEACVDCPAPLNTGYAQSKYVAEQILRHASLCHALSAVIIRVGQLSGSSSRGSWSPTEHIPRMFKSSFTLGVFPSDFPPVRWLPVDIAAKGILAQTAAAPSLPELNLKYYNLDNATSTAWEDIAAAVVANSERDMILISTDRWLDMVANMGDTPNNPAYHLLDFFRLITRTSSAYPKLDMLESMQICPDLEYGRIGEELLERYIASIGVESLRTS